LRAIILITFRSANSLVCAMQNGPVCHCERAAFILPPVEQIQLWQQHITKHELFTTGHLLLLLLFIWPDCAQHTVMPRCPFSFFSSLFHRAQWQNPNCCK
jgi:hypothetical protein